MSFKYLIPFLIISSFFTSCQHQETSKSNHNTTHERTAHEGHHTGVLQVSSCIQKDTTFYEEYVSQIKAHQHIDLKSLEEGYLQKIYIDEGQLVRKGQLLFELQPTLYLAEVQKAEAEVAQAKAENEKAEIEVQNSQALFDKGIISKSELALATAEMHKTQAQIDNAVAALNLINSHLKFTKIHAPFGGTIGRFENTREGAFLEAGEELVTLTDNGQIWVYFNIPESVYLDYMQHPANIPSLELKLANGQIFNQKGKITAIESVFDNTTGTVPVRATFKNPKRLLRHGQTGNILWPHNLKNMMFIPQKATFEILEKRFVFIINEEGVVKSQEIEVAAELDNIFAISKGLNPDDRFLIDGLRKVKNGDKIEFEYKEPQAVFSSLSLHAE